MVKLLCLQVLCVCQGTVRAEIMRLSFTLLEAGTDGKLSCRHGVQWYKRVDKEDFSPQKTKDLSNISEEICYKQKCAHNLNISSCETDYYVGLMPSYFPLPCSINNTPILSHDTFIHSACFLRILVTDRTEIHFLKYFFYTNNWRIFR